MKAVEQVEKQRGSVANSPLVTLDNNIVSMLRIGDPNYHAVQPVHQLRALNHANVITLNVTLSTVNEEQHPAARIEMHEYITWLQEQGISLSNIFTRPRTISFYNATSDTITFDLQLEAALKRRIHEILFPNMPFMWNEYRDRECASLGLADMKHKALIELDSRGRYNPYVKHTQHLFVQIPAPLPTLSFDLLDQTGREEVTLLRERLYKKWRNKKNDALGLYYHLTQAAYTTHPEQAVFVTNDEIFFKQTKVVALRQLGFPGRILKPADAVAFLCGITGISVSAIEVEYV